MYPKKTLAEIDSYAEKYFVPAIVVLVFTSISESIANLGGMWS